MEKIDQMIPSRAVHLTTEKTLDLTSSATGTVKRRSTSLESCKSTSPSKNENIIDFPNDNCKATNDFDGKDVVSASCKINKLLKSSAETSEQFDLSQEIAKGNSLKGIEDDKRRKINNKPAKKRFFDLKLTESAKKSLASKLKLPNRVSLTLSPRKTASPNNKLSLSQLEQQNNLFIRDGQQQSNDNRGRELEMNKNNGEVEEQQNTMEKNESNNLKQKQESLSGRGKSEMAKNKKSSLIPSFLGGSSQKNAANHIKIPSTSSGSVKKASSTTVVEKLTKTGNKFKELYRDFPSSGEKSAGTSLKRNPPPYRPPPTPPSQQNKQNQSNVEQQRLKKIRFSENDARNYEEIDSIVEETADDENKSSSNHDDISNTIEAEGIEEEQRVEDMLTKAEYSSNVFKNIPVRQKKGSVPHMENYCLFDPSVDFTNEKELMKKKLMSEINVGMRQAVGAGTSMPFQLNENEESIDDVTFEDQTVYDVSEHDEREKILAHHNYYEIDPDLLLEEDEDDESNAANAVEHIQINRNQIVPANRSQSVASKHRKSKVYINTLSTSSESTTSTSQTSTNSNSTTNSSDYPSLFNSVIETTHSSTVESTDDNDSNDYGKVKTSSANNGHAQANASLNGDTINQVNVTAVGNESVITISNVVTCGDSNAASTGAKKKSPQLNRIIRPSSTSSTSTRTVALSQKQSNKQQTSSLATTKAKSNKISLPTSSKALKLKSSSSLPHLQNVTVQNRCRQQNNELSFVIDNTTTIQLRRQYTRQGRPLSGHSDDRDSGFLSPVTPPDSQNNPAHVTPNVVIVKESETKTESTLLNQCDNIQQLIEVSPTLWRNKFFVVPF